MPFNIETVKTEAQAKYVEAVTKELTKKYAVIAKRTSQLNGHLAKFNARVVEFEAAVTGATEPAQVMEVLEAFKFPANSIHFTPRQDD